MNPITVGQRVQIIQVSANEQGLLYKFGRVMMIADGVRCVVALEDGGAATLDIGQLKKA